MNRKKGGTHMVKKQKKNTRKKCYRKGFKANGAKVKP